MVESFIILAIRGGWLFFSRMADLHLEFFRGNRRTESCHGEDTPQRSSKALLHRALGYIYVYTYIYISTESVGWTGPRSGDRTVYGGKLKGSEAEK